MIYVSWLYFIWSIVRIILDDRAMDSNYPFCLNVGKDDRIWSFNYKEDQSKAIHSKWHRPWFPPPLIQDESKFQFLKNVFRQATGDFVAWILLELRAYTHAERLPHNDYLKLSFIDFVTQRSLKDGKRLCKSFLKQNNQRNNLLLLDWYFTFTNLAICNILQTATLSWKVVLAILRML